MMRGSARVGVRGAACVALGLLVVTAGPLVGQERDEAERSRERAVTVLRATTGSGAWLGVAIEDVDGEAVEELGLPGEYGARVVDVTEESPAAEAGLRADDVVVSWNGERVASVAQLQRLVRETPPGRAVRLGAVRDGRERAVEVTLAERAGSFSLRTAGPGRTAVVRPSPPRGTVRIQPRRTRPGVRAAPDPARAIVAFSGYGRLGVSLQRMGDQLADYFGAPEGRGALVTAVREDTPAAEAGLRAGDVILAVGGEEIDGPAQVARILARREAGPVELRLLRDRQERTVRVELEERRDGGVFRFEPGEMSVGPLHFDFEPFDVGPWEFDMPEIRWEVPEVRWEVPEVRWEAPAPLRIEVDAPGPAAPGSPPPPPPAPRVAPAAAPAVVA